MPRFVILEHDHPELHWDLMLEAGEALCTWRLARPPLEPGETIAASKLADHRLHYLDYEGPVSGGRGTVKRWDAGSYVALGASGETTRHLQLHGMRVRGLVRLAPDTADRWTFAWTNKNE
jgi:hypothetical protein